MQMAHASFCGTASLLPFTLPMESMSVLTDKCSLKYSSLELPLGTLNGKSIKDIILLTPTFSQLSVSFTSVLMGSKLSISAYSDAINMQDNQDLCELFEEKMEEACKKE